MSPSRAPLHDPRTARVLVSLGSRHWELTPGDALTFGRGSQCDIRLAHDPLDEHVSRRAGGLECHPDRVVLCNHSRSRPLAFTPPRGRAFVLAPGQSLTCNDHQEFLVAMDGRDGCHYVLQVDATALLEPAP